MKDDPFGRSPVMTAAALVAAESRLLFRALPFSRAARDVERVVRRVQDKREDQQGHGKVKLEAVVVGKRTEQNDAQLSQS